VGKTGGRRKLHDEDLYGLYPSPNIIRVIKQKYERWTRRASYVGRGKIHTGFGWGNVKEKREGKAPLGRPRNMRENNIKMDPIK
jgi:hypothetical protein